MDTELKNLISTSPILSNQDKHLLLNSLQTFTPLQVLKIKQSLASGLIPEVLNKLRQTKQTFVEEERRQNPQQPKNIFNSIKTKFFPQKPRKILHQSILANPNFIAGPIPVPIASSGPPLNNLEEIRALEQLIQLNNSHLNYNLNYNFDQIVNNFLNRTAKMFSQVRDINTRRNYLMSYLQSVLFKNYINTGLTALRHPELKPRAVVLNLLFQINNNYLNSRQFKYTAIINNHIQAQCNI